MARHNYVVSVNAFSATCNWQVVGVQVEQNRCKDRALRKAVTLGSARTSVVAYVHPETVTCYCPETSISKQQSHQSSEQNWHGFTQFVFCKEDQCARQCHMLLLSPERWLQSSGSAEIHFR